MTRSLPHAAALMQPVPETGTSRFSGRPVATLANGLPAWTRDHEIPNNKGSSSPNKQAGETSK